MRRDAPPAALVAAATRAWQQAYAPYSGFRVGAALLADDGRIYAGANVENASYGLSRCAEQSAIQAMASAGVRGFDAIVVVTDVDPPASPCGACRQVLHEFGPQAEVWLVRLDSDTRLRTSVDALLPGAFDLHDLNTAGTDSGPDEPG